MKKGNIPNFIDQFAAYTKNNPGVGKYEVNVSKKVFYKPFRKYR